MSEEISSADTSGDSIVALMLMAGKAAVSKHESVLGLGPSVFLEAGVNPRPRRGGVRSPGEEERESAQNLFAAVLDSRMRGKYGG